MSILLGSRRSVRVAFVRTLWGLGAALAAASGTAGTLEVRVKDASGMPLPGAQVSLVELDRAVTSDAAGVASFGEVAEGTYHVTVRLPGFLGARAEVAVAAAPAVAEIALDQQVHFSESVTVSPGARDTFEAFQPTAVLSGEELQQRVSGSLGDTLSAQVGVNARAFGPGPSRPVIRGLDGDRVLILENGARTGDLSSQSGDHGTPLDPAAADQIEVVRGPATLLYGSNALGGVVNVVSQSLPTRPVRGVSGGVALSAGTADDEAGASGSLALGDGRWAVRLGAAGRRTREVDTPEGAVPNSQADLLSGGLGVSRTGDKGYAGVSYAYDDTSYGIPFVEEGNITLNPRRHRFDARAERRGLSSWIESFRVQLGHRDYRHDELEGEEVGTRFRNRFTEGQVLLNHRPFARMKGTFGLWGTVRDFEAQGAEALAPATSQTAFAAFLYEEVPLHHVTFQLGGRVDRTAFSPEGRGERRFTEASGALGVLWYLKENVTLAVNGSRAARNPSLEELYNEGPHPGNFAFEIGNAGLGSEVGLGVDVSLRWRSRRFTGEVTAYRNAIDGFIFPLPTGDREDDLPVVAFTSRDSLIQGLEAHADLRLAEGLWLELGADSVRGEIEETGEPLPRMPPVRAWAGLRYERSGFHLEGEVRAAARQDRVYGEETPTDGYTLGNLHAAYTFAAGKTAHTVTLRADNLGDTLYRNHLSFIKERTPERGRSLKLVYGLRF